MGEPREQIGVSPFASVSALLYAFLCPGPGPPTSASHRLLGGSPNYVISVEKARHRLLGGSSNAALLEESMPAHLGIVQVQTKEECSLAAKNQATDLGCPATYGMHSRRCGRTGMTGTRMRLPWCLTRS